jgi:hypothetical protein
MTDHDDAPGADVHAPHADAEVDPRQATRAANQRRSEPVAPQPSRDDPASTSTRRPDAAADAENDAGGLEVQARVPERAVTDVITAPGTSETSPPVQGVHTPDVGPGGAEFDTGEPALKNRNPQSR